MTPLITPARLLVAAGIATLGVGAAVLLTMGDDEPGKAVGSAPRPDPGSGATGQPPAASPLLDGRAVYAGASRAEQALLDTFAATASRDHAQGVLDALDGSQMLQESTDAADRRQVLEFAVDTRWDANQVRGAIAEVDETWSLARGANAQDRSALIALALRRGAAGASE